MSNETSNAVITLNALIAACNAANARYAAKGQKDRAGNVLESSDDIVKAVAKWGNEHTAAVLEKGALASKIDPQTVLDHIAHRMGVKAVKRTLEFASAIASGDYKLLDATAVLAMVGCAVAGAAKPDAARYAVTGAGDEHTSDIVRDTALLHKLRNVCKKIGQGTVNTQLSRSFGENGFCKYLGISEFAKSGKRYDELTVKRSNWFYKQVCKMIEAGSEVTLRQMKGADKE